MFNRSIVLKTSRYWSKTRDRDHPTGIRQTGTNKKFPSVVHVISRFCKEQKGELSLAIEIGKLMASSNKVIDTASVF